MMIMITISRHHAVAPRSPPGRLALPRPPPRGTPCTPPCGAGADRCPRERSLSTSTKQAAAGRTGLRPGRPHHGHYFLIKLSLSLSLSLTLGLGCGGLYVSVYYCRTYEKAVSGGGGERKGRTRAKSVQKDTTIPAVCAFESGYLTLGPGMPWLYP